MGGALHTLEDLLAHSNWIELSLRKMGHNEVFCHVGDSATIKAPGGQRVPPLVTGTLVIVSNYIDDKILIRL